MFSRRKKNHFHGTLWLRDVLTAQIEGISSDEGHISGTSWPRLENSLAIAKGLPLPPSPVVETSSQAVMTGCFACGIGQREPRSESQSTTVTARLSALPSPLSQQLSVILQLWDVIITTGCLIGEPLYVGLVGEIMFV